jgi:acyl carrier protein
MSKKIITIIVEELTELLAETGSDFTGSVDEETRLYGKKGTLDSIGLVNLTVAVEDRVADEFDIDIVLADERAMSMHVSPFSQVKRLAEWVETLLKEA